MVLMSAASDHSKRNYAKALVEIFALCELRQQPFSRALLMEDRAIMFEKNLSASTINVRLSAVGKLIGEARRNGILDAEQAAQMADVPNLRQKGSRMGNWLNARAGERIACGAGPIHDQRQARLVHFGAPGRMCAATQTARRAEAGRYSATRGPVGHRGPAR
jgi:hypothetical protein